MARLFSKRQGGWVDLPEEQVQEAYMSGLYAFPSDAEVNIQLPDGRYGTISSEHLQDAFRAGATYDQADVRQERIESAEYDERNLEAGGLSVARGLSFGLSDVLLDRLDLYSEEELAKLEKYNPNISLAGELTGAIAPALASGGTSLLARGLAKGTVAGLSAKAGIAAEKAIARRLGAGESVAGFELAQKTADKMIQGGAALTGAATVEGALFGAVDGFSEQMLGRADRTAEQMLSHVGGITALSGVFGGVLGLASPLIGKGLSAVSGSKYGKAVSDKTKDWEASILSAMHGGDKETYRKLLDSEYAHKVIFGSQKIADDAAEQVGSFIDDAVDGLELATRAVSGSEKQRLMREVVDSKDPLGAIDESINRLYQARQIIRAEMKASVVGGPEVAALKKADAGIQKQIDLIANMVAKSAAEGDVAIVQWGGELRAAFMDDAALPTFSLKDTYKTSDLLSQGMVDGVLPEVFIAMDSLKRAIGGVAYKRAGKVEDVATGNLMDTYHQIKNALEDESLFGAVAATRQREVNQAFTSLLPAYHKFLKQFTTEGEKAGLGTASRAATEGEAAVMATAESKALDEQIEILSDFRERLKADRTYDLEDIRPRADDGFDEYRIRAEADVGTSIVTKRVDEVANNIRTNVGDEAADAYEDAARAQAQRNIDTKRGKDPNVSAPKSPARTEKNQAEIKKAKDKLQEQKAYLKDAENTLSIIESNQIALREAQDKSNRSLFKSKKSKSKRDAELQSEWDELAKDYPDTEEAVSFWQKNVKEAEDKLNLLLKEADASPAASPGIPLIEKAFQRLEATIEAAKAHASTLDDGIESVVDYRKKLEVVNKKAGSLRGNLGRMKQGATPDAARMEAIRKELNEVVEESIELTNTRPGLGLDEAANRDTFRAAVDEHKEVGRALKIEEDKARAAVERAKKAKVKDPEALANLEKKLEDLIDRSVKHDRTPPLEKNYKKTKDLGEGTRRGRVKKWAKVKSFLKQAHKSDQSDDFRTFQEFVDNYGNFLRTTERQYEKGSLLTAEKSQTVKGLLKRYKSLDGKISELADIQLAYKEVRSAHSPLTTMLSAVPLGGLAVGGVPGFLASAATSALVTPAAGMKRRAAIHGVKSLVASNLNKRATQVVNRIVKNTKPGAPQKARALPVLLALLGVKAKGNPRDDARAAMNEMGQLADPDFLHSRLESSTKELAEAPKLREELFLGVAKHAGILADAASTDGAMNYDPITGENEITRSDADVSKFMSIAEIGIGGTNVVADKLMAGTLTKAEGNAYREFYPIESQELIETIQAKLSNQGKRISWDDRALLTNLSGIAMTNTLTPVFIGAMQSVHKAATKNASGRKGGNSLSKTGEAGTTLVEQAMYG